MNPVGGTWAGASYPMYLYENDPTDPDDASKNTHVINVGFQASNIYAGGDKGYDGEHFIILQLLPIMAGFFFACNIVLIRKYCRKETVISLTLAVGVMFFISACLGIIIFEFLYHSEFLRVQAPFVFIGWPKLTLIILFFSISCSFLNVIGNILLAKAYQTAESSWLAPIDYSYLIFAAIWGKLLFDIWPTYLNIIGISFIAVSGMLIAWRERIKNFNN